MKKRAKFNWLTARRLSPYRGLATFLVAVILSATAGAASSLTRPDATDSLNSASSNDVYVHGPGTPPQLMFACCDQGMVELNTLFAGSEVLADLKTLHAGLAVALPDLDPVRAQFVRRFNEAGIPTIAWIMFPREMGYYLNAGNAAQTAARLAQFDKWTKDNDLHWAAVGLDIEPDFGEFQWPKWRLARELVRRAFDGERVKRSRDAYAALIKNLQAQGYRVQTYQLMFLADERKAKSTMLERLFGVVDVRGDEEVLMTYSSFNHQAGAAMVWNYGHDAQVLAVGSTLGSGDPQTDARYGPLNWEEFSRDAVVASHFSRTVWVYSLEGCARQGFLPRLIKMDWNQGATIPAAAISRMRRFRTVVQTLLWTASHALYFAAILLIAVTWLVRWRVQARKARAR